MIEGDPLAHSPAHRMTHDVGRFFNTDRIQQIGRVASKHARRVIACRRVGLSDAAVIIDDHLVTLGEGRRLIKLPGFTRPAGPRYQNKRYALAKHFIVQSHIARLREGHLASLSEPRLPFAGADACDRFDLDEDLRRREVSDLDQSRARKITGKKLLARAPYFS